MNANMEQLFGKHTYQCSDLAGHRRPTGSNWNRIFGRAVGGFYWGGKARLKLLAKKALLISDKVTFCGRAISRDGV
jgi:hypothetical protein